MTTSPEARARAVFATFQTAVDTWVAEAVADCFTDDVVYVGTAGYLHGRDELLGYVREVFERNEAMRWELAQVHVFLDAPPLLGFAASGTIIGTSAGRPRELPFRLSLLVEQQRATGATKIRHFHGSVPIDAFTSTSS
ncbi:YybH family protein [Nocardioides cavernaquae]|uniref:YybH family protein n=1 Tax=Nocardioides cavernaquae TaxID=2321396 RepID=UPI0016030A0B|nr:nuclear transport factor 2 family protein [Nocardioides cavernaquae]